MDNKRRQKILRLPFNQFLEFFRGGLWVGCDLPLHTRCVAVHYDYATHCLDLILEHPSFEEVEEGTPLPILDGVSWHAREIPLRRIIELDVKLSVVRQSRVITIQVELNDEALRVQQKYEVIHAVVQEVWLQLARELKLEVSDPTSPQGPGSAQVQTRQFPPHATMLPPALNAFPQKGTQYKP